MAAGSPLRISPTATRRMLDVQEIAGDIIIRRRLALQLPVEVRTAACGFARLHRGHAFNCASSALMKTSTPGSKPNLPQRIPRTEVQDDLIACGLLIHRRELLEHFRQAHSSRHDDLAIDRRPPLRVRRQCDGENDRQTRPVSDESSE